MSFNPNSDSQTSEKYIVTTHPIGPELLPKTLTLLQQLGIMSDVVQIRNSPSPPVVDLLPVHAQSLASSRGYPYSYEQGLRLLDLKPVERFLLDCIVGSGLEGVQRKDVFKAGFGSDLDWRNRAKVYDSANRGLRAKVDVPVLPFQILLLGKKSTRRYVCLSTESIWITA